MFLDTLKEKKVSVSPPYWFMRQAGRTLPEYKALRSKAKNFWTMCLNPEFTVEATLQPIRRFDLSAAIIFSDILMIPLGLGQKGMVLDGKGPVLDHTFLDKPLAFNEQTAKEFWAPIFTSIQEVRKNLPPTTPLIGFAGGPWTVSCYMVEGSKTKTHATVLKKAYADPEKFDALIQTLTETTICYLSEQIKAGAQVIQLFESWAGALPEPFFERWIIKPLTTIAHHLKTHFPEVPITVFPKGANDFYRPLIASGCFDALNLDHNINFAETTAGLPNDLVYQGGLDPNMLLAGGDVMRHEIRRILQSFEGRPYIFNLSHGLNPETPISHIEQAIDEVKKFSA